MYEGRKGTTTENGLGARVVQDLTRIDGTGASLTSKRLLCDLLEVGCGLSSQVMWQPQRG